MHNAEVFAPSDPWGSTTFHGPPPTHQEGGSPATNRPAAPDPERPGRLAYAPGLDGVRALAVSTVVVFHLGAAWLAGGFLGVDVFFTLSGFLITSILLTEFDGRGHIDIRNFYLRRARRLLPALFTMLATITLVTWAFARAELYRLRGDVVAALTYSTNWTQIVWNRGYFDQLGRPSLLQHLWSLAVEEQFYLIWPLLLAACLASRRRWARLAVPIGLIITSLLLMAGLFHAGHDPARLYYGTDSHISPMLVGAVMATVIALRRRTGRSRDSALGRAVADLLALGGVLGLGWAALHLDYFSAALYRGGYLFIGLASAALIYAAARAGTLTSRVLGATLLVWIGQRSYAIYLWHWPILMLTRPRIDVPLHGPILVVGQVAAILLAADLSFRYVERPVRSRGSVTVGGTGVRSRRPARRGILISGVLALAALGLMTAPFRAPAGFEADRSKSLTIKITRTPSTFAHPLRVSFFGDSQGMTLLLNKPAGLGGVLTLSDSTVEGCGVLLGTIHSRIGYTRDLSADCGNWPLIWAANAAKVHPQVAVVEIGAWDVFDDTVDGRSLRFGSSGWDAYFSAQLAKGIRVLTEAGAQVALMGVPCYRPIAAGGLPLLPERGDDHRTRHVTSLLVRAATRNPRRVFMINPPAAFCTNPSIATDTAYRWDGTHYYKPGAALMFQVITAQLLAIPRPPAR